MGAGDRRELDGRGADAAGRPGDEHPVAHRQLGLAEQRVERGGEDLGEPAGLGPADAVGDGERVGLVDDGPGGLAAAADEAHHPVTDREPRHLPAGGDDRPGELHAGDVGRQPRRRRVVAPALQEVGAVQSGRPHVDEQPGVAGHRVRALLPAQLAVVDHDRVHVSRRRRSRAAPGGRHRGPPSGRGGRSPAPRRTGRPGWPPPPPGRGGRRQQVVLEPDDERPHGDAGQRAEPVVVGGVGRELAFPAGAVPRRRRRHQLQPRPDEVVVVLVGRRHGLQRGRRRLVARGEDDAGPGQRQVGFGQARSMALLRPTVAIITAPRTRSGRASASSWVTSAPSDKPATQHGPSARASSSPAASAASSATAYGGGGASDGSTPRLSNVTTR